MEATDPFFLLLAFSTTGMLLMAGAIVIFISFYQKKMLHEQMKQQQLEIDHQKEAMRLSLESQENERRRIAKDLHDGVQAMLQALRATVHVAVPNETDKKEIKDMTDGITETIRVISWDLMPSALEKFGLTAALEEFCSRLNGKINVPILFSQHGAPQRLDIGQELLLYRIAQEAVNNAIKHAKASKIEVATHWQNGLRLTIADDGVGFDFTPEMKYKSMSGLGLSNLENRAKMLNADLKFLKNVPKGSVVELSLPTLEVSSRQ